MDNGLQVPTDSGRFSILSAITCTYMFFCFFFFFFFFYNIFFLFVCREYVYYLILPLYVFYQKRTTSGTMLSQTRNLYGHRNRQNVVRSHSYNFHHIQSITTPSILSIFHLILLLCVFYQMRKTCAMTLSQIRSLYEHQNW